MCDFPIASSPYLSKPRHVVSCLLCGTTRADIEYVHTYAHQWTGEAVRTPTVASGSKIFHQTARLGSGVVTVSLKAQPIFHILGSGKDPEALNNCPGEIEESSSSTEVTRTYGVVKVDVPG